MKKRAFDVVVISLAAIVWVPVVCLSAIAVLLLSGRPIFYRSRRWVGPRSAIEMVKLRVMVPDASRVTAPLEAGCFLNTPPDSPLYTPIGRILDRVGLNELPQFVHVLKGDMSIVGARPLTQVVREALADRYPDLDSRWVTPAGLTGPPQLVGRHVLTDEQRLELEAAYSSLASTNYKVRTDFLILLYTVLIVLRLKAPLEYSAALALVTPKARPQRAHDVVAQQRSSRGAGVELLSTEPVIAD